MDDDRLQQGPERIASGDRAAVEAALSAAIDRYGYGLLNEPGRLEAQLTVGAPDAQADVVVVLRALERQIPQRLLAAHSSAEVRALLPQLVARITAEPALDHAAAAWSIRAWAHALAVEVGVADASTSDGAGATAKAVTPASSNAFDFLSVVSPLTSRTVVEPPVASPPAVPPVAAPVAQLPVDLPVAVIAPVPEERATPTVVVDAPSTQSVDERHDEPPPVVVDAPFIEALPATDLHVPIVPVPPVPADTAQRPSKRPVGKRALAAAVAVVAIVVIAGWSMTRTETPSATPPAPGLAPVTAAPPTDVSTTASTEAAATPVPTPTSEPPVSPPSPEPGPAVPEVAVAPPTTTAPGAEPPLSITRIDVPPMAAGKLVSATIVVAGPADDLAAVETSWSTSPANRTGTVTSTPAARLAHAKSGALIVPLTKIDTPSRATLTVRLVDRTGARSDAKVVTVDVAAAGAEATAPVVTTACTRATCGSVAAVTELAGPRSFEIIVRMDDRSIQTAVQADPPRVGARVRKADNRYIAIP